MKIQIKKIDKLQRQLEIEIPEESVRKEFDEVYEEIKKEAKIPGFRPGTAPRHLLEKHHSDLANEEVLRRLLPTSYNKAIEQENLEVLGLPQFSDVVLTKNSLKYKATFEIRPDIKVKNYKGIKLVRKQPQVTEEEIEKIFEQMKKEKNVEAIDDKIARGFGFADLAQFKDYISRQLLSQKETEMRAQLEEQVVRELLDNAELIVPKTLVETRYEELKKELEKYFQENRISKEECEKKISELDPRLRTQSEKEVKVYLILDQIAKLENLERDENMPKRVMEFIFQNAEWSS